MDEIAARYAERLHLAKMATLPQEPLAGVQWLSEKLHSHGRTMREVAELLEGMKAAGVIRDYAVFGAIAQMRYTEPVATLDAGILVMPIQESGLEALSPIYRYCEARGYLPQGEALRVGDWPVQFIPVFSPLTEEAVRQAETGEIEGVPLRVVSAVHLAAIALSVGRPKDHLRILSMLDAGSVRAERIDALAARHGLSDRWSGFKRRYLDE